MTTLSFESAAAERSERVRRRQRRASASEIDVSQLVAVIGHELSSPLTTINAAMELIETAEGQRPNALTATVRRQVSRLLALFDASLRTTEIVAGGGADRGAVTDLHAALIAVRESWPASEQRLHMTLQCSPHLPLVAIEDRAFAIIMNNLLVNACKHSGGREVAITADADNLVARVTLTDDGRGVPAHLRTNVFELGKRGQATSGSGLGLYVTRELARAFGGDIELADAPRGASFVLTLPLAASEAS